MKAPLVIILAALALAGCSFLEERKLRGVGNVRNMQQLPPPPNGATTQQLPPPNGSTTQQPPSGTQPPQQGNLTQQQPPQGGQTQPPQQGQTQQPTQQGVPTTQQKPPTGNQTQPQLPPQGGQQQPQQGGQGGQIPQGLPQNGTQQGPVPQGGQGGQQPPQGGQGQGQQPPQGQGQGQQPPQGQGQGQQPPQGPPQVQVRGAACVASAECSNNGCYENNQCRCQQGFSGLKCEQSQAQVSAQLNEGRNQAQQIVNRGPPVNQQGAAQVAQEIQSLAQNPDRPLPADNLKDLTSQMKAAVNVNGGNIDNLKAIANLGPKFIETGRRDDSNFQAGANGNQNLTVDQMERNEREKRDTMRNASIDQIKLADQAIKQYAANQRGNLQSGGEAPLPDMTGMKGTIARLDFSGCQPPQGQQPQQAGQQPPQQQGQQQQPAGQQQPTQTTQGQSTTTQQQPPQQQGQQQQSTTQQLQPQQQQPPQQGQQQGGQRQGNCGPPPPSKSGVPDPPQDKIKSPTYKFSIQNPAATNLPPNDLKNASTVAATATQQAFVNVPQSIGSRVGADAQFSFTASSNSFVPNLNNPRISGASPVYSVGFSNANGTEVRIANLTEPVRLCVPVPAEITANSSVTPTCAYINPNQPTDLDLSVEDDTAPPAGMMCCYLDHFSSFTIVGVTKTSVVLMISFVGTIFVGLLSFIL